MCGILQNSSTTWPFLCPSKFAKELLTEDTSAFPPPINKDGGPPEPKPRLNAFK